MPCHIIFSIKIIEGGSNCIKKYLWRLRKKICLFPVSLWVCVSVCHNIHLNIIYKDPPQKSYGVSHYRYFIWMYPILYLGKDSRYNIFNYLRNYCMFEDLLTSLNREHLPVNDLSHHPFWERLYIWYFIYMIWYDQIFVMWDIKVLTRQPSILELLEKLDFYPLIFVIKIGISYLIFVLIVIRYILYYILISSFEHKVEWRGSNHGSII